MSERTLELVIRDCELRDHPAMCQAAVESFADQCARRGLQVFSEYQPMRKQTIYLAHGTVEDRLLSGENGSSQARIGGDVSSTP